MTGVGGRRAPPRGRRCVRLLCVLGRARGPAARPAGPGRCPGCAGGTGRPGCPSGRRRPSRRWRPAARPGCTTAAAGRGAGRLALDRLRARHRRLGRGHRDDHLAVPRGRGAARHPAQRQGAGGLPGQRHPVPVLRAHRCLGHVTVGRPDRHLDLGLRGLPADPRRQPVGDDQRHRRLRRAATASRTSSTTSATARRSSTTTSSTPPTASPSCDVSATVTGPGPATRAACFYGELGSTTPCEAQRRRRPRPSPCPTSRPSRARASSPPTRATAFGDLTPDLREGDAEADSGAVVSPGVRPARSAGSRSASASSCRCSPAP